MKSPVIVVSGIAHLLAMLCFSAWGLSADFSTTVPSFSLSNPALQISRTSPERTTISLAAPQIIRVDSAVGFRTYQLFSAEGESFLRTEGQPALPQITRFYRIPNTGSVELNIGNTAFDMLDQIDALPYHELQTGEFKDRTVYQRDEWFPPQVAVMSAPMVFRDFRVVTVTLYPVQINPVTKQARIYRQIEAEIVTNSTPGENELVTTRRPSGAFAPLYRQLISNLDEGALDDATTTPGTYLIICKSDTGMMRWADSLRIWKKRQGYSVMIEARNNWTSATMRTAIMTLYFNADPPLEYVCLMGDPESSIGVPTDGANYDHTFALGNNGDDMEDLGIGRLCGESWMQMATINAKIMHYEREPYMDNTEWYTKGFFYSTTISDFDGATRNVMQWSARQFSRYTGVSNAEFDWRAGSVDLVRVSQEFSNGIGYFFWAGSGTNQLDANAPSLLNPGWMLPVTMTMAQETGNFASGMSLSEAFLVAGNPIQPRGGICGIGMPTMEAHTSYNVCLAGGMTYGIANLGIERLGLSLMYAKHLSFLTWSNDPSDVYFDIIRWVNLMGEPSLDLWTDVPRILSVTHAGVLSVGSRQMGITVTDLLSDSPVAEALVVLWKDSETYAKMLTDANGRAALPVTVLTTGNLLLTVTKHNCKPYLATIPCSTTDRSVLLSSYVLDDDSLNGTLGNNNHQVNPGELIDLPLYLRNVGTTLPGLGISADLFSDNPHITVLRSHAVFPDLAPGDSACSAEPFRIQVSPEMQNGEPTVITLRIVVWDVIGESEFTLHCQAPELTYVADSISVVPNPGAIGNLAVTIKNVGGQDMTNATGVLHSRSPMVTVLDSICAYGNLPIGQLVSVLQDSFQIRVNDEAFRGSPVPMMMTIATPNGFVDSIFFRISLGIAHSIDPTGPDAFGYYAFDNTDLAYWQHPTYAYLNISAGVGTNLNLNDPGVQENETPISIARALPFAFKFYGQVYDTITICSNGWAAFGNQAWNGTFRNYQIPGILAPDALLAPYWDDLQTTGNGYGVWEQYDADHQLYVIQWKARGAPSGAPLDFEIILYDTTVYPTGDGNGKILFQYCQATMNLFGDLAETSGSTIGIQNSGGLVGLLYAYQNQYYPGQAVVTDGRAILFATSLIQDSVTALREPPSVTPQKLSLYPNYPNPFNPTTTICYDLPQSGFTTLVVYNLMGQQVASPVNEVQSAGSYRIALDGTSLGSGVFFCRLENGGRVQTIKMMLMK